jgi:hypothetical protein
MTGVCFFHGVDREHPDSIDAEFVDRSVHRCRFPSSFVESLARRAQCAGIKLLAAGQSRGQCRSNACEPGFMGNANAATRLYRCP